jgi:predicted DNA-binding ribbon-helix-helix protein
MTMPMATAKKKMVKKLKTVGAHLGVPKLFRAEQEFWDELEAAAKEDNLTLTSWVRFQLGEIVKKRRAAR